jgi:signal transduction histidine kinase
MGDGYTARLPHRWRAVFVVGSVALSIPVVTGGSAPALAVPLIAAQAVAVWFLGDRPTPATASVLLVSAGLQAIYPAYGPGLAFVVLCTYAWLRPAPQTLWILGLAVVTACGPAALRGRWDLAGLWLGGVALAWSWGALARARGARRVAERRQAVLEERARIARDLHDVLSHTVSVMVVQAAAADDVWESSPEKAREALRRTEEAGRQALAELRGFLRTVREDGDDAAAPQPTLDDVERLAATMGDSGLRVTLRREGEGDVPLGVQVGVYRIVQEALTNTLRHARASEADVLLQIDDAEVRVRVWDNGTGGGPLPKSGSLPAGGHGLLGMRERAGLLGGTLTAGPRAGGGFEVAAVLPVRERP